MNREEPGPSMVQTGGGTLNPGLRKAFEEDSFQPHPLLGNRHLQTIVPAYFKRPMPDGWPSARDKVFTLFDESQVSCRCLIRNEASPTLLVLHGMGGSGSSRYIRGLAEKVLPLGWNLLAPSLYDVSTTGKKPTVFHSGCSRLVEDLLKQARKRLGLGSMFLAGVSMGGNILLKMIGEWDSSPPPWVLGSAAISPLTDLQGSSAIMEKPATLFYRKRFLRKLRNTMLRDAIRYQNYLDSEKVLQAVTIREFDEAFTVPLSGFSSVDEYYGTQSSGPLLGRISVPTLIIHSLDDPLLTSSALQDDAARNNPRLAVCLTEKGGHVGFFSRDSGFSRYWAEARIFDFLSRLPGKARFPEAP